MHTSAYCKGHCMIVRDAYITHSPHKRNITEWKKKIKAGWLRSGRLWKLLSWKHKNCDFPKRPLEIPSSEALVPLCSEIYFWVMHLKTMLWTTNLYLDGTVPRTQKIFHRSAICSENLATDPHPNTKSLIAWFIYSWNKKSQSYWHQPWRITIKTYISFF